MEIRIREKCADCLGKGTVPHPIWNLFYREHPGQVTTEDVFCWFKAHGYRYLPWPSEKMRCQSCGGAGVIEEWVSVKELLEMVAAQQ